MKQALYGWTDYPLTELGDTPAQIAPIRAVKVLSYDGNKYCKVEVGGFQSEIKRGYVYRRKGRCGEAFAFSHSAMSALIR